MGLNKSVVVALAALVIACTACGSTAEQASSSTSTSVPTQIVLSKGGTVTIGVTSLPKNFNPATVAGSNPVTTMVMSAVWPQTFVLNNFNAPQCPESVSGVCEGLLSGNNPAQLVSNSPQTVVYTINPYAKWSDGVSITASDFVFNWKMQLLVGADLPASDPIGGYEDIASVKGSNNGKTVTVVFAKPYADWQSLFTNLVPAHIAKNLAGWKHDFTSARYKTLVSGGPFMVEKYISSDELVLVRNPHYWGPEAGVAQIIFKVEPSQAAILQALATGSIDMASLLPSQKVANTVVESTDLTESTQPGADLWQLNFNLADPTVANLDLREAIALAIDRHQIVSDTVGLLTPFNNVAANHLFPYAYQGSQPNDSAYEVVNLTQSIAELASAGFTVSSDGIARNAAGAPLVLTLLGPSGNSVISGVEALIQSELLEIGIEVNITNVPSAKLLGTDLPRGEYQLALAPYLMSQFLSTDAALYTNPVGPIFSEGPGGTGTEPAAVQSGVVTRDVTGYTDANVTELFADASQELSAGATNTYNQIDTAIWADLPSLPLFQMPNAFISSARVLNVSNSQGWLGPMWNVQNWKIQVSPVPTTTTTLPS